MKNPFVRSLFVVITILTLVLLTACTAAKATLTPTPLPPKSTLLPPTDKVLAPTNAPLPTPLYPTYTPLPTSSYPTYTPQPELPPWETAFDPGTYMAPGAGYFIHSVEEFKGNLYVVAAGMWSGPDTAGRLFRSPDGRNWEPATDLGFGLGVVDDDCAPNSYDSSWDMIVFQDQLYLLPYDNCKSLPGVIMRSSDGMVWESVVTAKELGKLSIDYGQFYKFAVFNGMLYTDMFYIDPETEFDITIVFRSPTGNPGTWEEVKNFPGWGAGTFQTFKGALYLASDGVYTPPNHDAAPDQIWRTFDGKNWEVAMGDGFGNPGSDGLGGFAEYKDYLYVGEASGESGGGQIWRSQDGLQWEPVIKDGFKNLWNDKVDGLIVYGGKLYAYTVNGTEGCTVYRTEDAISWERVNKPGWGNSTFWASHHTSDQAVFKDELYMGAVGTNGVLFRQTTSTSVAILPTATPRSTSTIHPTDKPQSPTPQNDPSERIFSPIVYSPKADQALLFGGMLASDLGGTTTEAWLFDPQTKKWERTQRMPGTCDWFDPGVYDSQADRVLLYCGVSGRVMEYDFNTNTWSDRKAANTPKGAVNTRLAYDAESQKTILVGGIKTSALATQFDETWAYDYATNAWTKMHPKTQPPGLWQHTLAYDSESDRVILWGGRVWIGDWAGSGSWSSDAPENLVWAYDYNTDTWESFPVTDGPKPPRFQEFTQVAASAYDPDIDRTFFYWDDQFWSYDYNHNSWEIASKDVFDTVGSREVHNMTYLSSIQSILVFGGARVGVDWTQMYFNNKTWLFAPQSGEWTQVGP